MARSYICADCRKTFSHVNTRGNLPKRCAPCREMHETLLSIEKRDKRRRVNGITAKRYITSKDDPHYNDKVNSWKRVLRRHGLHYDWMDSS